MIHARERAPKVLLQLLRRGRHVDRACAQPELAGELGGGVRECRVVRGGAHRSRRSQRDAFTYCNNTIMAGCK
eukprot:6246219-Prymnesium_polylepis.1